MIYPISRMLAIKKLKEEELQDLHKREVKREFSLPFFNIKTLYWNTLKEFEMPKDGFTDKETEELNRQITSFRPRLEIFGLDYPTMSDLDFVHEWDRNIYHSIEVKKSKIDDMIE